MTAAADVAAPAPSAPSQASPSQAPSAPPPGRRDRTIDLVRVLAMAGVVLGHWLVTAPVATPHGWRIDSPLRHLDHLTPATWLLQTLALFFFAGGYASAARRRAAVHSRERMDGYERTGPRWLAGRVTGFTRASLPLVTFWAVTLAVLALLGVPNTTLLTAGMLAVAPLWFLVVYLALLAARPLVGWAERAAGGWAIAGPVLVVAGCDLVRHGPWEVSWAEPVAWVSVLFGWLVPFQLGHALATGRLNYRRAGAPLLVAGLAGAAGLVALAGYPASMVGVTGAERSNLNPVSLAAMALGLAQIGLYCLLRDRLARLLARARAAAAVGWATALALPVYLWHQSALVLVALLAGSGGLFGVGGLVGTPNDPTWLVQRVLWLPAFALGLALLTRVLGARRSPARVGRS